MRPSNIGTAANVNKVIVELTFADAALNQRWTYIRAGMQLRLVSVADMRGTEIERLSSLRSRCRRAAVKAWVSTLAA